MYFPTRDASTVDLASNIAGAALGGLVALVFDRAGLHRYLSGWRHRVFIDGKSGDLGLALLGIWLLVQVNPGIPLFAASEWLVISWLGREYRRTKRFVRDG